jgi:hypothetical protein
MKSARIVLAAAFLLIATTAFADPILFQAVLNGPSEPSPSPGLGFATATLDLAAHTLAVSASFAGLLAPTTAAHIHCCTATPFTGNAGVATQVPAFALFPIGVTAGSFSQVLDTTLASSWNPAFLMMVGGTAAAEAALAAGLPAGTTYFNIHTTAFPGGEIRGFLVPASVPEPSTIGLVGAGLVGILIAGRRRYMA